MSSVSPEIPMIYGLPVPPNTNSNQNPKHNMSRGDKIKVTCIVILFALCMHLIIGIFVAFEVITDDSIPKIHFDDVTLSRFVLSPTNYTLSYNLALNLTFRNPYTQVGIHVDRIDVSLMYQGQRLGLKRIPNVFYLRPKKEKSIVNVVVLGEHILQLINGDEKLVYASENKNGVYNIGLKLRLATRAKAMSINNHEVTFEIMCDNLEVPLSSKGNVSSIEFDSTKCSYEEFIN